eukprot:5498657-Karenia_brevis.AAC.1
MAGGVDRVATLALLRSSRVSDYQKGMLRSILAGGIVTQQWLFNAGLEEGCVCQACGQAPEDLDHL